MPKAPRPGADNAPDVTDVADVSGAGSSTAGAAPGAAPEASTEAGPEAGAGADADATPMNRAERRAKGKAGQQPPAPGKIQPGKTNLNHGPRQYANRRSG